MDARDKLRRYLEQRRELGETELVLDSMTVDEALRLVSGKSSSRSSEGAMPAASARPDTPAEGSRRDVPETSDWRAALRASGAAPEMSKRRTEFVEAEPPPIEPDEMSS